MQMIALLPQIFGAIIIANLHTFHVSVCEVNYNLNTHSLEISMKIFIDDLQLSINNQGNDEFKLDRTYDKKTTNLHLKNYLKDRFKIKINAKQIDLNFLGFKFKEHEILCFLEVKSIEDFETIEIENSILLELFDDQINLTHIKYKDEMKSIKTTRGMRSGIIDVSEW